MDRLRAADAIIVAGQAASHCVRWTISDIASELVREDPSAASRIYILRDCTSAVAVPDGLGGFVADYTDDALSAFAQFEQDGMHLVESNSLIANWTQISVVNYLALANLEEPPAVTANSPTNSLVGPLLTDLYEITATYAYWKAGQTRGSSRVRAVLPPGSRSMASSPSSPAWRRSCVLSRDTGSVPTTLSAVRDLMPHAEAGFFDWLRCVDCSRLRISAIAEGSVVFPGGATHSGRRPVGYRPDARVDDAGPGELSQPGGHQCRSASAGGRPRQEHARIRACAEHRGPTARYRRRGTATSEASMQRATSRHPDSSGFRARHADARVRPVVHRSGRSPHDRTRGPERPVARIRRRRPAHEVR